MKNPDLSSFVLKNMGLSGRNPTVEIRGNSMLPLLRDGQSVTVDTSPAREVRPGDIILFLNADRLVAHRVLAVRSASGSRRYIEKGDNQLAFGMVNHEEVLGTITAIDGKNDLVGHAGINRAIIYSYTKLSYLAAVLYRAVGAIYGIIFKTRPYPGIQLFHRALQGPLHLALRLLFRPLRG